MSMSYQIFIFTYSITNGILFDNKKGRIQPPAIFLKTAAAGSSLILFYCFLFLFLIYNGSAMHPFVLFKGARSVGRLPYLSFVWIIFLMSSIKESSCAVPRSPLSLLLTVMEPSAASFSPKISM